jgi:hypothetical protein
MKLAYMNSDEVNQELAVRVAALHGAVVYRLVPDSPLLDGPFDAVLYNLDEVPSGERSVLLDRLCLDSPHRPTAVHGYDITEEQARSLNRSGIPYTLRLHRDLLRNLLSAARRNREVVREDAVATDLTWVNLVR